MSSRIRHPVTSFLLFVVIAALGYVAYLNRDRFKGQKTEDLLTVEKKEMLKESILEELEKDMCFIGLRGHLNWRPNEQRYILHIEVEDSETCERKAKEICDHIALLIQEKVDVVATVIAYDRVGREIVRTVK